MARSTSFPVCCGRNVGPTKSRGLVIEEKQKLKIREQWNFRLLKIQTSFKEYLHLTVDKSYLSD